MAIWTPEYIDTALWLDASDSATITLNGSTISQWSDKSGNGNHASQSTAAAQPALTAAGLAGMDVATFDGVDDYLALAAGVAITTNMTVAIVFGRATAGIYSQPMGGSVASAPPYPVLWWTDNITYAALGSGYTTHGAASTATGSFITITTRTASSQLVRRNGVQLGITQPAPSVGTNPLVYIGRRPPQYHKGVIAEIVLCAASEDVQRLEGYLAWKWGLQGSLPSGHPYYAAAPNAASRILSKLVQSWGDFPAISADLVQLWGLRFGADFSQRWSDAPIIKGQLHQHWGNAGVIKAQLVQRWRDMVTLRARLDQPWAIMESLLVALEQPWAITATPVQTLLNQGWSIKDITPVLAALHQPWSLAADGTVLRYTVEVLADGHPVRVSHVNIEGGLDESGDVLTCEIHPETEAEYLLCTFGAELQVSIASQEGTDAFVFVVTDPRINEQHGSTSYVVEAMSPAAMLGAPYAAVIDGELFGQASEIAASLAGSLSISWETVDWHIPAAIWIASGKTPLALLKTLAAAVGALVQSDPDGSIAIRPRYPVSVPKWATTPPDVILTETLDCFDNGSTPDHRYGYNRFLISNQSSRADSLTLEQTDISGSVKEVRGYQVPWDGLFYLTHTGGAWVVIETMGIEEREETETVEFVAGAGSTQYPVYRLVSVVWQQVNLGTITTAEDGSLTAAIEGQSLCEITYATKCRLWRVTDGKDEQLQLVAEL